MKRGLPKDSSVREARIRKAASSARGKAVSSSSAPWWHHAVLWVLLLATLPLVNLKATPQNGNTGVAIMLSPLVLTADAGVSLARSRGSEIPQGDASWPRVWARGFGAAIYAFVGLWLSYRLALRFAGSPAALLATVAIWLASSLPVYLYVQPFSTHAVAMFAASLFVTTGLSLRANASRWRWLAFGVAGLAVAAIFFGGQATPAFRWTNPKIYEATFSMTHGAFVWTPILLAAVVGLGFAIGRQPALGGALFVSGALFLYLAAAFEYADPAGAAFGNQYLIPLVPVFVTGLAALIAAAGKRGRMAWTGAVLVVVLAVAWNLGLMLQWGTGLIAADRPLDIRQAAANQLTVVPRAAKEFVVRYFNDRRGFVSQLEGGARE